MRISILVFLVACGGGSPRQHTTPEIYSTDKIIPLGAPTVSANQWVQNLKENGCMAFEEVKDEKGRMIPSVVCAFKMPGEKNASSLRLVTRDDTHVECIPALPEWEPACKYIWDRSNGVAK